MLWFTSDNGPEGNTGDTGTTRGSAGPFRGRKRSLWEGGIHEPGLLEWPARIKPGTVTAIPCSTLDYFPTTLDLLGFRMHGQPEPIDGVSLVPLFDGTMKERPVPIPFETLGGTGTNASRGSPRMALVDNRFKFLTDMEGPQDRDLLYDLLADPGETSNLIDRHPEIAAAMKQKLAEFRISYKRSLAGKDYATPFTPTKYDIAPSDPGFVRGSVRGGEGKAPAPAAPAASAKVVRQDEDSGMVDLTAETASREGDPLDRAASVSWQFMIYQPGSFAVEVTTAEAAAGSRYELTVGNQKIRGTVASSGARHEPKTQVIGSLRFDQTGPSTLWLQPIGGHGAIALAQWKVDLIPANNN
jgi:hypothetical protein